jgi:hypothetical protein
VSELAAWHPNWSAESAAKPTKMYVGGWIVKQKGLPPWSRNFQAFFTAGALKYRRGWLLHLTSSAE